MRSPLAGGGEQPKYASVAVAEDAEEEKEGSSDAPSFHNLFANLFLLFFGSGTFALPWAFTQAGLAGGVVGVLVVAAVTHMTIMMLVVSKRKQVQRIVAAANNSSSINSGVEDGTTVSTADHAAVSSDLSYAVVTSLAFGTDKAGLLVKLATTMSSIGACAGYLAFISGLLAPSLHQLGIMDPDSLAFLSQLRIQTLLIPILVVIIPLTWIRSFKELAWFSTVGNLIFLVAVALVLSDGISRFGLPTAADFVDHGPSWKLDDDLMGEPVLRFWPESVSHYSLFIGPCIYLFTIHYCALPLEAETSAGFQQRALTQPGEDLVIGRSAMDAGQTFDSALAWALAASAAMNAVVGGVAYSVFMRAPSAPLDPGTDNVLPGCTETVCDDASGLIKDK